MWWSQLSQVVALLLCTCLVGVVAPPHAVETARAGGVLWCRADPIVSLDGRLVDISVSIPLEYLPLVNGPTHYQIKIPASVDRVVVLNDLGFNLYGSEVTFVDGGAVTNGLIPVEIRANVPMQLDPGEAAPMEVIVWPDNELPTTVMGTNRMTTVRLDIKQQTLFYSVSDPSLAGFN